MHSPRTWCAYGPRREFLIEALRFLARKPGNARTWLEDASLSRTDGRTGSPRFRLVPPVRRGAITRRRHRDDLVDPGARVLDEQGVLFKEERANRRPPSVRSFRSGTRRPFAFPRWRTSEITREAAEKVDFRLCQFERHNWSRDNVAGPLRFPLR